MDEKTNKTSSGAGLYIFLILLLIIALGIVYYMGFVKNNEKINDLENEKKKLDQQYNEKISNLENEKNKLKQQLNNSQENKKDEIIYEEITQDLKDDEMFYVADYKDNNDGTYTLYGVIYKRNNNAQGSPVGELVQGSYKKVTVSSSLVIDELLDGPGSKTVKEIVTNLSKTSKFSTSVYANDANSNLFAFTFKNGKCTKMYYYGLGI